MTTYKNRVQQIDELVLNSSLALLRPVVQMLLRHGLTYPGFAEALKHVYVHEAEAQFTDQPKRPTDSRISVLTGVHRKDVKRLRDVHTAPSLTSAKRLSLARRVVECWMNDAAYLDDDGQPRCLARSQNGSDEASFETLVAQISKGDTHPRTALDELMRLDVVNFDHTDKLCLNFAAILPEDEFEERMQRIAERCASSLNQALSPPENPALSQS